METEQWHKAQNERISRLADEMAKLYTLGHNAIQNARYEATRQEYLQAMTDKQWHDYADDPPTVNYRDSG